MLLVYLYFQVMLSDFRHVSRILDVLCECLTGRILKCIKCVLGQYRVF